MKFKTPTAPHRPNLTEPDNSADSSMHDKDAMLLVIASLIHENQKLESENHLLRSEMLMQQANFSAKQATSCSGKPYRKPKQAHPETFNWEKFAQEEPVSGNINLRRCKFCKTFHVWGKFHCPNFNKELVRSSKFKFSRTIASARNSADEGSSNGKQKFTSNEFPEYSSDVSPRQSKSYKGLNYLFKQHSSSVVLTDQNAENQTLAQGKSRISDHSCKDNYVTALKSERSSVGKDPEKRGFSYQRPDKADRNNQKRCQNLKQKENELGTPNKRKYRTRKGNMRKISNRNVDVTLVHDKQVYSNKVKLNALKTPQECIEIMGWTKHSTYEKEYRENKKKIRILEEKEKCNIII